MSENVSDICRQGGIRTPELRRGWIYSPVPLTTRPPTDCGSRGIRTPCVSLCWFYRPVRLRHRHRTPICTLGGNRTHNPMIKSHVLYQLSYEGILSSLLYEKLDILCTRRESNPRHLVKSQGHIPFATSASLLFFGTLDQKSSKKP